MKGFGSFLQRMCNEERIRDGSEILKRTFINNMIIQLAKLTISLFSKPCWFKATITLRRRGPGE